MSTGKYSSVEDGGLNSDFASFDEKSVRLGFIRKVYLLLSLQLLISFGFVCIFSFSSSVRDYCSENTWILGLSAAIWIVTIIALACCGNLRRQFPTNLILLFLFTIAMSFFLGTIAGAYSYETVLLALGMTCFVVFAVSIFACQTKYDFTTWGGMLFVALLVLIAFSFLSIFFYSRIVHLLIAAAGALLFTVYLAYDTQLLIGGRRYELSPEEYVFGALNLYLDVINIFLYLLALFGNN